MFTGIVRERGRLVAVERTGAGVRLTLDAPETAQATAVGDSVALDGCCLTATAVENGRLTFDAVPETLARTTLGRLQDGAALNVEPAVRAGESLGGHYVQGHVDAVGRVRSVEPEGDAARIWVEAPREVLRYCAEKGSIAINGVSLTIAELAADSFAVALVPHTLTITTLGALVAGDEVNLEADVLAKYVERLISR
ncbi:MAG: riboflavin synthase [Thermoleophilia bacterium]|nr:riboflavin synthase [Thermoleophilia bacterium]